MWTLCVSLPTFSHRIFQMSEVARHQPCVIILPLPTVTKWSSPCLPRWSICIRSCVSVHLPSCHLWDSEALLGFPLVLSTCPLVHLSPTHSSKSRSSSLILRVYITWRLLPSSTTSSLLFFQYFSVPISRPFAFGV